MATCQSDNAYDGRLNVRISSVPVIFIASLLGAVFPVLAAKKKQFPRWILFICRYFGSGVVVATAFIHLLPPAHQALSDPCLTGPITTYPWPEAIVLMSIFTLFFVEVLVMRAIKSRQSHEHGAHVELAALSHSSTRHDSGHSEIHNPQDNEPKLPLGGSNSDPPNPLAESYAAQLTGVFILEFGVVFHSAIIGLTLVVSGKEFCILYVIIVFHQLFEGLAVGARLASIEWPASKKRTPYIMALVFGISAPLAMAVGLGMRMSYTPGSRTALMANGFWTASVLGY